MKRFLLIWLFVLVVVTPAKAEFIPDTPEKQTLLVNAIYHAEGGNGAKFKYGIRSVQCSGEGCRHVCLNTVKNNLKRWTDAGRKVE